VVGYTGRHVESTARTRDNIVLFHDRLEKSNRMYNGFRIKEELLCSKAHFYQKCCFYCTFRISYSVFLNTLSHICKTSSRESLNLYRYPPPEWFYPHTSSWPSVTSVPCLSGTSDGCPFPPRSRGSKTGIRSFPDNIPLKFRQGTKNMENQFPPLVVVSMFSVRLLKPMLRV
jgi:hypothetical protein